MLYEEWTFHYRLSVASSCQSVNKWHEWGMRVGADERRARSYIYLALRENGKRKMENGMIVI